MDWTATTNALIGGSLIGIAASLVLLFNGKIFGVSGILAGTLKPGDPDFSWRFASILGMVFSGVILKFAYPTAFESEMVVGPLMAGVAGIIVGFGTNLGSGCTSGHGICGISRFSVRSIIATCTFIASGAVTVYIYGMIGR